jgi:Zinc finger, C3HC4 type (RING finger)./RNA recognition motif.
MLNQPVYLDVTVDHTKVKIGPGFSICKVVTGFESRWIIIDQVQQNLPPDFLRKTFQQFGTVRDINYYPKASKSATVKVAFQSADAAMKAAEGLDGSMLLGKTLSVHLPLSNSKNGSGIWDDTCVQLSWNPSSKTGYAGYPLLELAQKAVKAASGAFLNGLPTTAEIHQGIPSIGEYTVRFRCLPSTAVATDLEQFQAPEAVVLEKPNYVSHDHAVKHIQRILKGIGEVRSFDTVLPLKVDDMVQASVHFSSHTEAMKACSLLHNKPQHFLGKGRIFAIHVKSISYTLPSKIYDCLASDIRSLMETSRNHMPGCNLSIFDLRKQKSRSFTVFIRLSGPSSKEIGNLKADFEKVLRGEIITVEGKAVWDTFFETSHGHSYLLELETLTPAVSITRCIGRRTIILFGPKEQRHVVRLAILERVRHLTEQKVRVIKLDGKCLGPFMGKYLLKLQHKFGRENVMLDFQNSTVTIRGSDEAYETACEVVALSRRSDVRHGDCPICFDEAVSAITLECGHSWCRSCLSHYLITAVEIKPFPISCLGGGGLQCAKLLPIFIAQDILTAKQFDALVQAAFLDHVNSRLQEFHFCPTPDCPEVYRNIRSYVPQCPSCLVRICPKCNKEYHDSTPCEGEDEIFQQWAAEHGVKNCPGCKSPIQRVEGCNHIVCIRCRTHICWFCLQTFPKGDNIYNHMETVHGGIYMVCFMHLLL